MKKCLSLCLAFILIFTVSGCKCDLMQERPFGVWWWDDTLSDEYLSFASENGVNEIYYCNDDFDNGTSSFIEKANELGIDVYWLAGEYEWLNDSSSLHLKINNYMNYQNTFSNKFKGIHLDIEPHQDPLFDSKREELITSLIVLANDLNNKYPKIFFDYDLPFWLDDKVSFNGQFKEAYKYIIDIADRVFLMSYRDSAQSIYDVSEEEIEYSTSVNKILILGIETKSDEGDSISFQEEGQDYMYNEIINLWKLLPSEYGVAIHNIKSWYEMKE